MGACLRHRGSRIQGNTTESVKEQHFPAWVILGSLINHHFHSNRKDSPRSKFNLTIRVPSFLYYQTLIQPNPNRLISIQSICVPQSSLRFPSPLWPWLNQAAACPCPCPPHQYTYVVVSNHRHCLFSQAISIPNHIFSLSQPRTDSRACSADVLRSTEQC